MVLLVGAAFTYQQYRSLGGRAARLKERIVEEVLRGAGRFDSTEDLAWRIRNLAQEEGIPLQPEQVTVRFVPADEVEEEATETPRSELGGLDALLVVELRYTLEGVPPIRRGFDQRLEKPIFSASQPFIPSAPPAIGRAVDPGVPAKKDINAYRRDVQRAMGGR